MKHIYILLAVAVVVGGGSFTGGMKYAQNRATASFQNMSPEERRAAFGANGGMFFRNGGSSGTRAGGGNFVGAGLANGEIIANDTQSVTVKLRDGGSRIVFYSDSTHITKPADGSSGDLMLGRQVAVNGTANSDGSITAESIQVRLASPSAYGPSSVPASGSIAPKQ